MFKKYKSIEIAQICNGKWVNNNDQNISFNKIQIDERKMEKNDLYIAIKGQKHDGHIFVKNLKKDCFHGAIVEKINKDSKIPQLIVKNSIEALQKIAKKNAVLTNAKKIAVTGSVGKTGTKEMLVKMMVNNGIIHSNHGNFNNHIGLPLTLAQTPANADFLIAEMGMNHFNEIKSLSKIMLPNICAITKISNSHIGNFKNIKDIAKAKSEIFFGENEKRTAIIPRDDEFYHYLYDVAKSRKFSNIISFGRHPKSDFQIKQIISYEDGMTITASFFDQNINKIKEIKFQIGMNGEHWAENALCALAICYAAGINPYNCIKKLKKFSNLNGRGKQIKLKFYNKELIIIDDSYNASPESMSAALKQLAMKNSNFNSAILSDMLELGKFSKICHLNLAEEIQKAKIKKLIAIGPFMKVLKNVIPKDIEALYFNDSFDAIEEFKNYSIDFFKHSKFILVKGSKNSGANNVLSYFLKNSKNIFSSNSKNYMGGEIVT